MAWLWCTIVAMSLFTAFLLVLALCLFFMDAVQINTPRFNKTAGGLFCVTLAYLLSHWPKL